MLHIAREDMIKNGFYVQKYDDVCSGRSSYKVDELLKISENSGCSLTFLLREQTIFLY